MSSEKKENTLDRLPCRVLLVEDELRLLEHLTDIMNAEGFSTFTCSSFRDLENLLALPSKRFDLIILDRLLNGRDSAELITRIKIELPNSRIMILSAINTPSEKALLLDFGADDYVAKPFDSEELVARTRALLRRNLHRLKMGNVTLNSLNRTMLVSDQEVALTNKEFILLRTLLETPGKIFNKSVLYEKVWEMSADVESNVVEATVNKLRRRLTDAEATLKIKNTRNLGYWVEE